MKSVRFAMTIAVVAALFSSLGAAAQDKPFKVGSTATGVPFTFLDTKTNSIQGIMVDIIKAIAQDAAFKVEVEPMTFSTLIPSLTGNKIDIIAAAMYITPTRQEVVNFSGPIYTWGEGLIVSKKDSKDYTKLEELKGMTVGVQKGTAYIEPLQKSGLFTEVKIYDTIPAILSDVNAGRIQAGFGDKPIVAYNLQLGAFPDARLVKSYVSTMTGTAGLAVRKGDTALLARINASLEKLRKNGTVDKILAKWGQ